LVTEPCPKRDLCKLKHVTENSKIPVLADESAATLEDVRKIVESRATDGINLKLQKIGGIHRGLKAARLARTKKVNIMVGCMMESGVSISCGISFASALNASYTDLDTHLMLEKDIITEDSRPTLLRGSRMPTSRVELDRPRPLSYRSSSPDSLIML
jgi:L-alanine-DL-glutamate epimerase-like enolase superfamily enzyme